MLSSPTAARPIAHAWPRAVLSPALVLTSLTLMTRLPLRSRMLFHWDSVNFAFAIRHFDIARGEPQAPGYLLYVLLGRAAAWLTGSAQQGYVLLSIVGTALAALAIFDLGRRLWDRRAGWLAALFLLFSPLFWFYGEVALPHTLDALMVIVAATLSWRVWQGESRMAPGLALWLGFAGGLREQTLIFLLPLALVACRRLPPRLWLASAVVLVVTTLAWLLPLLALSGGLKHYLAVNSAYSEDFDRPTSVLLGAGWPGLRHNLSKLIRYTLWAWAGGLVPIAVGWLFVRSGGGPEAVQRRRSRLLWLWALPALGFYTLVHMGQPGLSFVYLPTLLLLSGGIGSRLITRRSWGGALVGACLAGNALLYLTAPAYARPGNVRVWSQATIREHDALLRAQTDAVRACLPPGALLVSQNWRFPQYYLPQAHLYPFGIADPDDVTPGGPTDGASSAELAGATALAWYEPELDRWNRAPDRTTDMGAQNGVRVRLLRRTAGERFYVTPSGFGVEKAPR